MNFRILLLMQRLIVKIAKTVEAFQAYEVEVYGKPG